VNVLDQQRQVIHCNAIVADMGSDDVGSQGEQSVVGTFICGHCWKTSIEQRKSSSATAFLIY
jgi:hypothetical protein